MPMYEFIDGDGNIREAFFKVSETPDIGQTVNIDGITCRRVISSPCGGYVPAGDHARFSRGLGCWVKNRAHEKDLQKAHPNLVWARDVDIEPRTEYEERLKRQADEKLDRTIRSAH